jgi:hypothetical protein
LLRLTPVPAPNVRVRSAISLRRRSRGIKGTDINYTVRPPERDVVTILRGWLNSP